MNPQFVVQTQLLLFAASLPLHIPQEVPNYYSSNYKNIIEGRLPQRWRRVLPVMNSMPHNGIGAIAGQSDPKD
jgi:hypothetical protein